MASSLSSLDENRHQRFSVEEAQEFVDDLKRNDKESGEDDEDDSSGHKAEGDKPPFKKKKKKSALNKALAYLSIRQIPETEENHNEQPAQEYPEGYNKEVARMLVDHSSAAYCPNCGAVAPIFECGCPSKIAAAPDFIYVARSYDAHYDASASCGYDSDRKAIIASFRGTASITNWKANLRVLKGAATRCIGLKEANRYPSGVRVHKGFYDTYAAVESKITAEVVQLAKKYPDFQVYVTGHSMGGAQATLCAADLVHNHSIKSVIGYTLGQPQVFDAAGKIFFKNLPGIKFYRVVNGYDPVPILPGPALGYHHVGKLLHFKSVNKTTARKVLEKSSYRSLEEYTEIATKTAKWATFIRFRIIDHQAYAERYGARRVLRGTVPPDDPWDETTKAFRVAVARSLGPFVRDALEQAVVVFVHASRCSHCRKFWPIFTDLATKYRDDEQVQFLAIDGTANDLPRIFVPFGKFPSIFLKQAGAKERPKLYEGYRTAKDIETALLLD